MKLAQWEVDRWGDEQREEYQYLLNLEQSNARKWTQSVGSLFMILVVVFTIGLILLIDETAVRLIITVTDFRGLLGFLFNMFLIIIAGPFVAYQLSKLISATIAQNLKRSKQFKNYETIAWEVNERYKASPIYKARFEAIDEADARESIKNDVKKGRIDPLQGILHNHNEYLDSYDDDELLGWANNINSELRTQRSYEAATDIYNYVVAKQYNELTNELRMKAEDAVNVLQTDELHLNVKTDMETK